MKWSGKDADRTEYARELLEGGTSLPKRGGSEVESLGGRSIGKNTGTQSRADKPKVSRADDMGSEKPRTSRESNVSALRIPL